MRFASIFAIGVVTISTLAVAQTHCSGSPISGVVQDITSAMISHAAITLDGLAVAKTDVDGRFTLPCVGNGSHRIQASAEGFETSGVTLRTPTIRNLVLRLSVKTVTVDIEVGEHALGQSDAASSGPGIEISGARLQGFGDDPDDLLRQLQQLAALGGGNPAKAIISVDGFQDSSRVPPKSSIAYIRVNPDLFSAEYREPPFGGGRVDIYTKPGKSTYHGDLFATNGSPWMNARDPFSLSRASIGKQRYGFDLSGPVHKVGSDFALSLERRTIDNFAVVNAVALDTAAEPVAIIRNIPTPQTLWVSSARLDWQLTPHNTLMVGFSGYENQLSNVGVGGTTLSEGGYSDHLSDNTVRLAWVTTASASLMHELRASIRLYWDNTTPNALTPQVQVSGSFTGGGSSVGNQAIHQIRSEINDDAVIVRGKHTLKIGTQIFLDWDRRRLPTYFNGAYIFGGGTAPALDANSIAIPGESVQIGGLEQYRRTLLGLPGGVPTVYNDVQGDPHIRFFQLSDAFFVQDNWKIGKGFTAAWGLRFYEQSSPFPLASATPRVGLQWTPGEHSRLSVYGHVGLFTGYFSPKDQAELLRQDGRQRITSTVYAPVYGNPFVASTPVHSYRSAAHGLSNVGFITENVGAGYDLGHKWSASVDLFAGRLWNATRSRNINSPLTDDPLGPRPGAAATNILQLQNSGQGRFDIESISLSQSGWKGMSLVLGAVHINQFDNTDDNVFFTPQSSRSDAGEIARRSNTPAWQVFASYSFGLPLHMQLSGSLYGMGGARYNITTGSDDNGDGNFNDRPRYTDSADPEAVATKYGLLSNAGSGDFISRNLARLPWTVYLDCDLQRSFRLHGGVKTQHEQNVTVTVRSSNLLNHTNITQVGAVLGSPLFDRAYAADNGRRIEASVRYSF